ncbi:MAG: helix-turn-helix transcriptional regulator [Cyclobacteriaceae bacterium]|nr:helix-turn-helix transcriptional regulator [Cyclobacteriaceae bacterium HetDA_MAG_MS6]
METGQGIQRIEEMEFHFQSGDFFLLTPKEHYSLELHEKSKIHFIKFQKVYFNQPQQNVDVAFQLDAWFSKLEYIFNSYSRTNLPIIKTESDKKTFEHLISITIEEYFKGQAYCKIVVQNTLFSLLSIIARNLQENSLSANISAKGQDKSILEHIHFNIYENEKLTIAHLSARFHISKNYFGSYFKKQYGIAIKQYILNYKIALAEEKLTFTDLSLSEIAYQLDFSDLQHFNKTFQKIRGILPNDFRKNGNPQKD